MTRRNVLDRHHKDAQQPISTIPLAKGQKCDSRTWDRKHCGKTYYIPMHLHQQTKTIRASIVALSEKYLTNTSSVASALISFSLAHIHQGKCVIEARPDARRRKMALIWEEAENGRTYGVFQPKQKTKRAVNDSYINYRWGGDLDAQIKALVNTSLAAGEVVVFLLNYALNAYEAGRLRLKVETVVVLQKESLTW